jgi:hypothetical protein
VVFVAEGNEFVERVRSALFERDAVVRADDVVAFDLPELCRSPASAEEPRGTYAARRTARDRLSACAERTGAAPQPSQRIMKPRGIMVRFPDAVSSGALRKRDEEGTA